MSWRLTNGVFYCTERKRETCEHLHLFGSQKFRFSFCTIRRTVASRLSGHDGHIDFRHGFNGLGLREGTTAHKYEMVGDVHFAHRAYDIMHCWRPMGTYAFDEP